jgi:predicted Zn-dependent protease
MPQHDWTDEDVYLIADRAYAFYRQGCYPEAAVLLEGLTEIDPGNAWCRTALAAVALEAGEPARAVEELTEVLKRNPSDRAARARRCEAYCELKMWSDARRDLDALQRDGDRVHTRRLSWRLEAARR